MPLLRDGLARFLRSASVASLQNLKLRRLGELADLRGELQAVLEECQQVQAELEMCELALLSRRDSGRGQGVGAGDVAELCGELFPPLSTCRRRPALAPKVRGSRRRS